MSVDPIVPVQDPVPAAPAPTTVPIAFPEGTFVESIAFDADGRMFVSVHNQSKVVLVRPEGEPIDWATLEVPATGLCFASDGRLFCSGGAPGTSPGSIWLIEGEGRARRWVDLPDAIFLNGMTLTPNGTLLVVDSLVGRIFAIDTLTPEYSVWFESDLLRARGPDSVFPGANGIKIFGGAAWLSNTDRATILKIPLDHGAPSAIEVVAERLLIDDFAFDESGRLYGASHAYNLVVRLDPDGTRRALAGPLDGAVNPTAVAFGSGADATAIFVTTTGGIAAPIDGKLQPARLLRLEVGSPGAKIGN